MTESNISFTKLSTEDCETCWLLELSHGKKDEQSVPACKACKEQEPHELPRNEARTAYKNDGESVRQEGCAEHRLSVIMLPIMPGIKTVLQSK